MVDPEVPRTTGGLVAHLDVVQAPPNLRGGVVTPVAAVGCHLLTRQRLRNAVRTAHMAGVPVPVTLLCPEIHQTAVLRLCHPFLAVPGGVCTPGGDRLVGVSPGTARRSDVRRFTGRSHHSGRGLNRRCRGSCSCLQRCRLADARTGRNCHQREHRNQRQNQRLGLACHGHSMYGPPNSAARLQLAVLDFQKTTAVGTA